MPPPTQHERPTDRSRGRLNRSVAGKARQPADGWLSVVVGRQPTPLTHISTYEPEQFQYTPRTGQEPPAQPTTHASPSTPAAARPARRRVGLRPQRGRPQQHHLQHPSRSRRRLLRRGHAGRAAAAAAPAAPTSGGRHGPAWGAVAGRSAESFKQNPTVSRLEKGLSTHTTIRTHADVRPAPARGRGAGPGGDAPAPEPRGGQEGAERAEF